LTQVTSNCTHNDYTRFPVVRFDGQQIVFLGIVNFVYGLYRIPITGGPLALITTSYDQEIFEYRMSTIPIPYVVSDSPGNNDGLNPNHRFQIARMTTGGAAYLRITADPVYDSMYPDISGDGNKMTRSYLVGVNDLGGRSQRLAPRRCPLGRRR
jgi:Tol biopolymer transport system component